MSDKTTISAQFERSDLARVKLAAIENGLSQSELIRAGTLRLISDPEAINELARESRKYRAALVAAATS